MRIPDDIAAKLLDALRPREREVLGLHFFDQFSIPDMAHMLEVKPDSISGHLSKGLRSVAKIVDAPPDKARDWLDALGELRAKQKPKQSIVIGKNKEIVIDLLPHREVMGAAVKPDEHLPTHTLRYFVSGVNGHPLSVEQAEVWALDAPAALGSSIVRELLALKGVKPREKFDRELHTYFWPMGFGCTELYYERDFDHRPRTLPLPPGESLMDFNHLPPVPEADLRWRSELVPKTWPFRVIDLGEYAKEYDLALAEDAERARRYRRDADQ